jgi:hypothetical protein
MGLSHASTGNGEVITAADKDWQILWSLRMEDPQADVESFQLAPDNLRVMQLRQKLSTLAQAQYIGLIKFSAPAHGKVLSNFIQHLINNSTEVNVALHHCGWLEVDSTTDLNLYQHDMAHLLCQ